MNSQYRSHSDFELYGVSTESTYPASFQKVFGNQEVFPPTKTKGLGEIPPGLLHQTAETVDLGGMPVRVPQLELLFLDKFVAKEGTPRPEGYDAELLAKQYVLDRDKVHTYLDQLVINPRVESTKARIQQELQDHISAIPRNLASIKQKLEKQGVEVTPARLVEQLNSRMQSMIEINGENKDISYSGMRLNLWEALSSNQIDEEGKIVDQALLRGLENKASQEEAKITQAYQSRHGEIDALFNNIEKQYAAPEESADKITLRFPEVYKSPEWQALPSIDRAQLLLVAEGLKPGTIIGGNFTSFQKVIERLGLATHLNSKPNELDPVYEVATPEAMDIYYHQLVNLPQKAPEGDHHRITGRFLGYPACCTEEYIKPQKNREAIKQAYPNTHEEMPNVEFEARQLVEQGKPYPELLDYAPPTFTPCSATCNHALARLSKWRGALQAGDPAAARDLQLFNWQSEPYYSAHEQELNTLERNEATAEKLRFLRKSAGLDE